MEGREGEGDREGKRKGGKGRGEGKKGGERGREREGEGRGEKKRGPPTFEYLPRPMVTGQFCGVIACCPSC